MNILLPTDAFPPVCGGSGWSTYELARGLRARGHAVLVVRPVPGREERVEEAEYDGIPILEFGVAAPHLPYVRNYFKNERLYAKLARFLQRLIVEREIDLVHGQHVMTCLPSIEAASRAGVPAVCTVRDYWPVCYWSDLIHSDDENAICPRCSAGMMMQCIRPRAGALWPLAVPMIPYMRANLSRKRRGLARANAVVAVSSTIAADLRARAPELSAGGTRIEIIPNPVDIAALRSRANGARSVEGPYALYLGKLAPNKGTEHLLPVIERAQLDWPLVVAGDGPGRAAVEAAAARSTRQVTMLGWINQPEATRLLARASMLVFPSRGPESLSRVLIEASALGVPIAAMNTGGTADIIVHGETGLLSRTPEELANDVRRLREDEGLRERLGRAAVQHAASRFDAPVVLDRIEALYREIRETAP